jgi:hypothetical protein
MVRQAPGFQRKAAMAAMVAMQLTIGLAMLIFLRFDDDLLPEFS